MTEGTVPFLRRLHPREYAALFGSFILIGLEIFIRIITLALPNRVIQFCYNQSRGLFNLLSSQQNRSSRAQNRSVVNPIAQASDFVDLCNIFGYYAEEHIVHTEDGYLLGIHRLAWKHGEENQRINAGEGSIQKKVVYLHHGLMMNSEVWVCLSDKERCLPFTLVEKGYDVWLGNNRGNKYSKKSNKHSPATAQFWKFSIDQFAFHDIPDSIAYILSATSQPSLSYIGFSQGTAQAFATLSIHPMLNDKVDVFVALAPAMSPPGLANGIVASLVKSSPEVLYLAFGRRSILSSATMWQALLYPPIFVRLLDSSLWFLFGWRTKNITLSQKLAAYPHLYSFTSTKSVVHWFQIIRNRCFQMFDDEVQGPLSGLADARRYYKVAKFPTRNIKTPVVLVYGGSDSLVNIEVMMKELPQHTVAKEISEYEHLDFLWAQDVDKLVFPHVFDALDFHAGRAGSHGGGRKEASDFPDTGTGISRSNLQPSSSPQPPTYSEDERGGSDTLSTSHRAIQAQSTSNDPTNANNSWSALGLPSPSKNHQTPSSDLQTPHSSQFGHATPPAFDDSPAVSSLRWHDRNDRSPDRDSISSRASGHARNTSDARVGANGINLGTGKAANGVSGESPIKGVLERGEKRKGAGAPGTGVTGGSGKKKKPWL